MSSEYDVYGQDNTSNDGSGCGCTILLMMITIPFGLAFLLPGVKSVWGLPLPNWYIANSPTLLMLCVVLFIAISPFIARSARNDTALGCLGTGTVIIPLLCVAIMLLIPGAKSLWGLPFPTWYIERSAAILLMIYIIAYLPIILILIVGPIVMPIIGSIFAVLGIVSLLRRFIGK